MKKIEHLNPASTLLIAAYAKFMPFCRDRVKASERVSSGEFDMDDLCSQLKMKAKCSGKGAVIDQADVDKILGPLPSPQQDQKGLLGKFI